MSVVESQLPNASVSDVVNMVNKLVEKNLGDARSEYLNPSGGGFYYSSTIDANFIHRNVFTVAPNSCILEADELDKMMTLIEKAKEFAVLLYTWRSCTIPLPKNMPMEGNILALEVLEREMEKLKKFFLFQKEAVEKFKSEIIRLTNSDNNKFEFISKTYFSIFGKFIGILVTLDELKNTKASIKNDFAYYKRISEKITKKPELSNEVREMSLFLATHNCILGEVKRLLGVTSGYEDLFCNVINCCLNKFEHKDYLLPDEKYDFVKVTAFLIYLLDGQNFNINKSKKLNISKIDSMFKQVEVLPLFGDVMFRGFNYVERTPNFDASNWPKCMSGDASPQSSLVNMMPIFRQQHTSIVSEYSLVIQSIKRNNIIEILEADLEKTGKAYDVFLSVLGTLSTWTSCIVELVSWKLTHPVEIKSERPGSSGCPPEATSYERVTKYNYTDEEKSSLVELIGFIKGLHRLVGKDERLISSLIKGFVFVQLQKFVNLGIGEPIRKALKHHKDVLSHMLVALQTISADPGSIGQKEVEVKKGKKTETIQFVNPKYAPPSQTQLYMVQSMLEFLVDKSNPKSPGKDLDSHHVKSIKEFLNSMAGWNHALHFEECLKMSCDLSQLWYREFYLEMTRGEEIQFPIEESLTWILISHVLEKKNPYLIHFVMNLFELYDDYAQFDLFKFKKQFLFSEIEAEATLCFEQLVFKLSEYIYEQHKIQAASIVLNKKFKMSTDKSGSLSVNYKPLMCQKNVHLLGRSVNLHHRISQMMNDLLLKSINIAITRFEFSDITGIVELQTLLKINKEAHILLSKNLSLDDFDALWHEANHDVTAPYGRVSTYTLLELTSDFLPHYCYNASTGRFVMTTLPFADKCKREKPPNAAAYHVWGNKSLNQCYTAIHSRFTDFVGEPHFMAMVEIMGYQDVAMLTKELVANNSSLIRNSLLPYLTSLQGAMPKKCILPRYDYTSSGVLGYYEMQLSAILTYSDLQPKVFQCLREIGNSILFVLIIEQYQTIRENLELASSAMFLKVIPRPYVPCDDGKLSDEIDKEMTRLMSGIENKFRFQNIQAIMSKNATLEQNSACNEHILLTKDKLSSGLYIFRTFLLQLRTDLILLDDPLFDPISSSSSSSSSLWCVESNTEFHRLWSAMQFVMCRTLGQNELTVEELFGEGLNWAGCTMLFLLGHRHRFQVMDSCYHLHNVNRVDQIDKICAGVPLRKMVDRIRKFQILNDEIFSSLVRHFSPGDPTCPTNADDFGVKVEYLEPLNPDLLSGDMEVSHV